VIAYDRTVLPEFAATWRVVGKESVLLKRTSDRLGIDEMVLS
jgi:hypothetical protein